MSLPIPRLDDLDFETLAEQARAFIPRYAPDWTDHNIHDPGITLLELAAWLVDQQIYRVGFVSDRHIRAFAALLGINPKPAESAMGLIWPAPRATENGRGAFGINLVAGARVTCVQQPEIPFELEKSVYISPARMVTNTDTHPVAPALKRTSSGSEEIELEFDRPLIIHDGPDTYSPIAIGIEIAALGTKIRLDKSPGGYLVADYRFESDPPVWRRIPVSLDTTASLNQTGIVLLNIPAASASSTNTRTISHLRIRSEQRVNPLPTRIKRVELNVLPIIQTETIPQSVIGISNGLPDQTFYLNLEFLPRGEPPIVEVIENDRYFEWALVESLQLQGPDKRGFELCEKENEIRFGNGVNGRIPPNGAQIRHLNYKLTLGKAGNLQPGLSWTVTGAPLNSGQTSYGINPALFFGGADAWGMERIIAEARDAATKRTALLTNAELEDAAKSLEGMGVHRTSVLTGFHPALPKRAIKNARALIVMPERLDNTDPRIPLSQHYLTAIARALKSRRILGERLSILPARKVAVKIQARLTIEDGTEATSIIERGRMRLMARLSDVHVNNEWDIAPWPVGRDVTRQEIKALLAGVEGVVAVTQCQIAREDNNFQNADLSLQRDEIAIGVDFQISTVSITELRS